MIPNDLETYLLIFYNDAYTVINTNDLLWYTMIEINHAYGKEGYKVLLQSAAELNKEYQEMKSRGIVV